MTKYLIIYSFLTDLKESGNGNMELTHKKYFKDISELEYTKKLIKDELKGKVKGKPSIVIENIIKFPIK